MELSGTPSTKMFQPLLSSTPEKRSSSSASLIDLYDSDTDLSSLGSPQKRRLPNEPEWVDLDNSSELLSASPLVHEKIIPVNESQLEMETLQESETAGLHLDVSASKTTDAMSISLHDADTSLGHDETPQGEEILIFKF